MYGILTFDPKLSRLRVEEEGLTLLGRPFRRVTVKSKKQLKKAANRFKKAGIRRVVSPAGEPVDWQGFGLVSADPAPFLQAQAAQLVLAALAHAGKHPAQCIVALRGDRATARMGQAAAALCPGVKGLCLTLRDGDGGLAEELYAAYGLGVLRERPGLVPDGAVQFSTWGEERPAGVKLSLFEGKIDLAGAVLDAPAVPPVEGCARLPLLAALWEAGALDGSGIRAEWT